MKHSDYCFCNDCRQGGEGYYGESSGESGDKDSYNNKPDHQGNHRGGIDIGYIASMVERKIIAITEYVKENFDMIPEGNNQPRQSNPTRRQGTPRLGNSDLSTEPREITLLKARYNGAGKYGPAVDILLDISGSQRSWSIKLDGKNPNQEILVNALGNDESKWIDVRMMMALVQDDWDRNLWFPRITEFAEYKARSRGKKKA